MEELVSSQSDVVGRLAFKYMVRFSPFPVYLNDLSVMSVFNAAVVFCQEMCKVDSSSDSESESNPRGSDVSSKVFLMKINLKHSDAFKHKVHDLSTLVRRQGCDSSAPEAPQTLQRFTGHHQQVCLHYKLRL